MPFVPYMVYDMGLVDDYREPGLYAGAVLDQMSAVEAFRRHLA